MEFSTNPKIIKAFIENYKKSPETGDLISFEDYLYKYSSYRNNGLPVYGFLKICPIEFPNPGPNPLLYHPTDDITITCALADLLIIIFIIKYDLSYDKSLDLSKYILDIFIEGGYTPPKGGGGPGGGGSSGKLIVIFKNDTNAEYNLENFNYGEKILEATGLGYLIFHSGEGDMHAVNLSETKTINWEPEQIRADDDGLPELESTERTIS